MSAQATNTAKQQAVDLAKGPTRNLLRQHMDRLEVVLSHGKKKAKRGGAQAPVFQEPSRPQGWDLKELYISEIKCEAVSFCRGRRVSSGAKTHARGVARVYMDVR